MYNENAKLKYKQYNLSNYLYIWLMAIIIFTIVIISVGYYNFPYCLIMMTPQRININERLAELTPAYPPPLVAFN
jgi:hypothetical protein